MTKSRWAWEPHGPYLRDSRVRRFMDKHGVATWQDLIRRSTEDIHWFWNAALEDLGIEWFEPYHTLYDDSNGMPRTKWFLGGKLNIAHNCLDRHLREGREGRVALLWEGDEGTSRQTTYGELAGEVGRIAAAMLAAGVKPKDVIGLCMSVSVEAVAVMFAAMKIGAACMQIAARWAASEVVDALLRGKANVLFIDDAYRRAGKTFEMKNVVEAALRDVPSLEKVVVVGRHGEHSRRAARVSLAADGRVTEYPAFLALGAGATRPETLALDAEEVALILFSSGTTGRSKAIVHTHGGALAQVAKEVGYAFDCRESDVFYWFTNIGWMMAPWEIVGALFFGASVVLFEGTHLYPTPHRIFELIDKYGITIFGFTPTAMRALAKLDEHFEGHDLSTLRILGSTGEPLDPETWWWYFRTFGRERCPIMNISGGTELIGCLLSPLPVMPLKPSTLGGPGLGMAVDVCDESGKSLRGRSGSLVCRKPFPSMTRGFLGEPERYLKTYFPMGENLWVHGDRAEIDADGYWYIVGRADDLIVSGGVKHDPAKIEAALVSFPGPPRVKEAAAVGVKDAVKGQRIVAFVVPDAAIPEDDKNIVAALREHVGKTYDPMGRPDEIYAVPGLPRNLAAKIPRAVLRRIYEGEDPGGLSSLDNPQVLEDIRRALRR